MEDIELAACGSTGGELCTFPVDSAQWESAKWVANNLHKFQLFYYLKKPPFVNISLKTQSI